MGIGSHNRKMVRRFCWKFYLRFYHSPTPSRFKRPPNNQRNKWGAATQDTESKKEILRICWKNQRERGARNGGMSSTNNQNYGVKESRVIEWSQGVAESVHCCSWCTQAGTRRCWPYLVQLCSWLCPTHRGNCILVHCLLCLGFPLQFLLHTFYHSSFFCIIVLIFCTAHTSIPGPSLLLVLSCCNKSEEFLFWTQYPGWRPLVCSFGCWVVVWRV